jgi:DNA repair ATPase RecN
MSTGKLSNLDKMRKYLQDAKDLPYHGGQPCREEIAKEAGLKARHALYGKKISALLEEWEAKLPARGGALSKTKLANLARTNRTLETKKSELYAENAELKRALRRLGHIEKLLKKPKAKARKIPRAQSKEADLAARNRALEAGNASLYAEVSESRRTLRKLRHIEDLFEQGRSFHQ